MVLCVSDSTPKITIFSWFRGGRAIPVADTMPVACIALAAWRICPGCARERGAAVRTESCFCRSVLLQAYSVVHVRTFCRNFGLRGTTFRERGSWSGVADRMRRFLCHASCRVLASPLTWRRFQPSMFQASRSRLLRLVLSCPIPFLWHTHNRQQWGSSRCGATPACTIPRRGHC